MEAAVSQYPTLIKHLLLHHRGFLKFQVKDIWTDQTMWICWVIIQIRKQIHLATLSVHMHFNNLLSTLSKMDQHQLYYCFGGYPADMNGIGSNLLCWLYFHNFCMICIVFAYWLLVDLSCMVQLCRGKPTGCYSLHNQEATLAAGQEPPATERLTIQGRFSSRQLNWTAEFIVTT